MSKLVGVNHSVALATIRIPYSFVGISGQRPILQAAPAAAANPHFVVSEDYPR